MLNVLSIVAAFVRLIPDIIKGLKAIQAEYGHKQVQDKGPPWVDGAWKEALPGKDQEAEGSCLGIISRRGYGEAILWKGCSGSVQPSGPEPAAARIEGACC